MTTDHDLDRLRADRDAFSQALDALENRLTVMQQRLDALERP